MTASYGRKKLPMPQPTYNARQLNQYFKTIKLPPKYLQHPIIRYKSIHHSNDSEALRVLKYLIKYQLANIPFENLELHYSTNHTISVDPQHLFRKMVDRRTGRGGYCMENTQLFVTVLRSLGYRVIATGARVNRALQPTRQKTSDICLYEGWNHMVAIVSIGINHYLVDVGFGNNSLTFPVPLKVGYTASNGRPSHKLQLSREPIPDSPDSSQEMWVYSVKFTENPDDPWVPAYCFSHIAFKPHDFEAISSFVSKNPNSWFTQHVICTKFVMDMATEEMIGDVTLYKQEIKERRNGVVRILADIKTEKDRVEALQKFLGVRLSETEKKGIQGLPSAINEAPTPSPSQTSVPDARRFVSSTTGGLLVYFQRNGCATVPWYRV